MGDDRYGVGVNLSGIPEINWCHIKGGNFIFGTTTEDAKKIGLEYGDVDLSREMPSVEFHVNSFQMSKYPVTNLQYKTFISSGGYQDKRWWDWSDVSLEWLKNNKELDLPSDSSNLPVVGVSWFEAIAFCKWLSMLTGKMIRLPYETEWEYASKNKYLNFSFGNEFDKNKCVSKELNLKMAAPVGMNDIGSNLPCDMTGNIWEWTLSIMKEEENLIDYKKNSVKLLIA